MKNRVIKLNTTFVASAGVVGGAERSGPLGGFFDMWSEDDRFESSTWEKAESEMQRRALGLCFKKSGARDNDVGALFAGDLLNQCVGSAYGLLDYNIPYFGLYGACSTAAEGILLASIFTSNGVVEKAAAVTSSHYCSAERQYRTPIEYGAQRTPTAQRTVTGSGAFLIGNGGKVKITEGVVGIVVEKGINDAANMGAAMAPAALSTLCAYFDESGKTPSDFDMILTGDLGFEGGEILCDLMRSEGYNIEKQFNDCGLMIYARDAQDMHAGGSGCGCSASVLASYIIPKLERGELHNILFVGTGAMMSPSSIQQGLAIPGVAHLLHLEGA